MPQAPTGPVPGRRAAQRGAWWRLLGLAAAGAVAAALAAWTLRLRPPGTGPALATAPGGLAGPGEPTALRVEEGEFTFDFRADRPGHLAVWPWVTVRLVLHNPGSQAETLAVGPAFLTGSPPPFPEGLFTIGWQGQQDTVRVDPGRLPPAQPAAAAPTALLALDPDSGRLRATVPLAAPAQRWALRTFTVPAGGRAELTVRFRQQYTGCSACGSREPSFHYTHLLSPHRRWAAFGPVVVRAIVPPEATLAAQPALAPAGTEGGAPLFAARFPTLPPDDLHLSVLLHRPSRLATEWPWWLAGAAGVAAVLYLQYRLGGARHR